MMRQLTRERMNRIVQIVWTNTGSLPRGCRIRRAVEPTSDRSSTMNKNEYRMPKIP